MPTVIFKAVTESDLEQLRVWRNTPRIREYMFNQNDISKDQQKNWFEQLQIDNTQKQFVCWLDNKAVGVLNFTSINENDCEWGCYIGDEHILPGFGLVLTACALIYAFNTLEVNQLNAQVFSANKAPQKINKLFKYKNIMNNNERNDTNVLYYRYEKNDWVSNKAIVFSLLPKHLLTVIETATFDKTY